MEVLSEIRNHVAFITLNRPAALNALSLEMILRLRTLFEEFSADPRSFRRPDQRAPATKHFAPAGIFAPCIKASRIAGSLHHEFFAAEYPLDYLLYSYPKPYAALLDGITLGGGMGISQGSTLAHRRRAHAHGHAGGRDRVFSRRGRQLLSVPPAGPLGRYLALTGMQIRRGRRALLPTRGHLSAAARHRLDSRRSVGICAGAMTILRTCSASCGRAPRRPPSLPTLPRIARRASMRIFRSLGAAILALARIGSPQRVRAHGRMKPRSSCAAARRPC